MQGLKDAVAESLHRDPTSIASFQKLAEGGFNRVYLITFDDGFETIAKVPFNILPTQNRTASEVATMTLLGKIELLVPEVYG